MKIAAIIAEYNPFHNGHKYQIEQIKKRTGADYVLILMSGYFVQRGMPAMLPKYDRAKMALENGADVVIELPVFYAASSAEFFAKGSVSLLNSCGCVDLLCFGSEYGNLDLFHRIAEILLKEPTLFKELLQKELKNGRTFPFARSIALCSYFKATDASMEHEEIEHFLSSPNNILGLEYIKALLSSGSRLKPITIKREGADYHSTFIHNSFCSASAVRAFFEAGVTNKSCAGNYTALEMASFQEQFSTTFSGLIPVSTANCLTDTFLKTAPVTASAFSGLLQYARLTSSFQELCKIMDIGSDLAGRIHKLPPTVLKYNEFVQQLKTKQLTQTRIQRGLLHLLLHIKTTDVINCLALNTGYLRLLGFKKSASPMLKKLKSLSSLPIITKPADAHKLSPTPALIMLETDFLAAHLYNQAVFDTFGTILPDEFRQAPVMID